MGLDFIHKAAKSFHKGWTGRASNLLRRASSRSVRIASHVPMPRRSGRTPNDPWRRPVRTVPGWQYRRAARHGCNRRFQRTSRRADRGTDGIVRRSLRDRARSLRDRRHRGDLHMLNAPVVGTKQTNSRNFRRERKLWHDSRKYTPSLGCGVCADRETCGGLCIQRSFYDCSDNCCRQPDTCDAVCRTKPREFAQRVREVNGFGLGNVPHAAPLPKPPLPQVVPVLYHSGSRKTPFAAPVICLSLYSIVARNRGARRFPDATAVADGFRYLAGTPVILTGTANDRPMSDGGTSVPSDWTRSADCEISEWYLSRLRISVCSRIVPAMTTCIA